MEGIVAHGDTYDPHIDSIGISRHPHPKPKGSAAPSVDMTRAEDEDPPAQEVDTCSPEPAADVLQESRNPSMDMSDGERSAGEIHGAPTCA